MAFNGDETGEGVEPHKSNSYFEAFDGIVAALDALAKAVTPDGGDDGTPPEEGARPCCNSYFASFRNITDALVRLKSAVEERIAAGGGIEEESDPVFRKWRDEGYSIGLGKGAVAGSTSARTTLPTVQLGAGQNTVDGTLQFRDWQIVDASGTIPAERLSLSSLEFRTTTITRGASGFCNINDHAVNSLTLDGQIVSFVLPAEQTGRARAFILRLTMQSATTWGFPPSSLVFESDDEDVFREIEVGATATLSFFEVSHRCFIVSRKDTKAVAKPEIPI
ncbi:MAG: hypothetical protein ACI4QF_03030 [Kiritimatiellia bacterium]